MLTSTAAAAFKSIAIAKPSSAYGRIVVIKRNGQDSASFDLTDASYTFGKGADCDIRIQLLSIAEEHCRIVYGSVDGEERAILCNLTSIGTMVNGRPMSSDSHLLQHGDTVTIVERSFRFESIAAARLATPIQPVRQTPVPGSRLANHTSAEDAAKSSPSAHSPTRTPVREHHDHQQHSELPALLSISRSTAAGAIAEVTPPGAIQREPPGLASNSPEPTKSPTRSSLKPAKTPERTKPATPAQKSPLKAAVAFGVVSGATKSPLGVASEAPPDWIVDEQPALSPVKAPASPSRFVVTPTKASPSVVDDSAVSHISPRLNSQPGETLLGTPQRIINSPVMQRTPETSMIVDGEISASPRLSPKIVRIESPSLKPVVDSGALVEAPVECSLCIESEVRLVEDDKQTEGRELCKDEPALTQESVHFEAQVSGGPNLELSSQAISGSLSQPDSSNPMLVTNASQIESTSTARDPSASCTQESAVLIAHDFDHHRQQQDATTAMIGEQGLDNPFYVDEVATTAPSALAEDQMPRSSPRRPSTSRIASTAFTATPTKQAESVDAEMGSAKKTPQSCTPPHMNTLSVEKSTSVPQSVLHSATVFAMPIATPIKQIDTNTRFTPEIYKAAPPTTPSAMHNSLPKTTPSMEPVAAIDATEISAPASAGIPEAADSFVNVASISTPSKQQLIEKMAQSPQNTPASMQQAPIFHVASPSKAANPSTPSVQAATHHTTTLPASAKVNTPSLSMTPSKAAYVPTPSKPEGSNAQPAAISSPARNAPVRPVVPDGPADGYVLSKEASTPKPSSAKANTPLHAAPAVEPATPSASARKPLEVDGARSTSRPASMPASAKKTPAGPTVLSLRNKLSRSASKTVDSPMVPNSAQPEYLARPAQQAMEDDNLPKDCDVDMMPAGPLDAKPGVADDESPEEAGPTENTASGPEDRPGSTSEHDLQTSENMPAAVHPEAVTDSLSEPLANNSKPPMQAEEKAATEEDVEEHQQEASAEVPINEPATSVEQMSPMAVDASEIVNEEAVQSLTEPSFASTPRHSARARQLVVASASAVATSKTPKQESESLQAVTTGKRSTRASSKATDKRTSRAQKDPEVSVHEDEPKTATRQSSRRAGESKSVTKKQPTVDDTEEPKTATRRTGRAQKQGPSKTPVATKARATSKSAVKSTTVSKRGASARKAAPATEPARRGGKGAADGGEETGMEESPTLNAAARRKPGKQSKENVQHDAAESFTVGKKRAAAHAPDEIASAPAKRRQLRSGAK